jgi:uncharacterized protein with HEPN domain
MRKDNRVYIRQMIDAVVKIEKYLDERTFGEFKETDFLFDAVMRQLMIIGEASLRFGPAFRRTYDRLPWAQMKGMRNRIIHEYDGLNERIIWDTCRQDLPALKIALEGILEELH